MSDERTPDFESAGVHEVDLNTVPTELPILPLRDTILFPHAILPLAVARESSVALVNDAIIQRARALPRMSAASRVPVPIGLVKIKASPGRNPPLRRAAEQRVSSGPLST